MSNNLEQKRGSGNKPKNVNKGVMNKLRDSMPYIIIFLIVAFLGTIIFEWGMNYLGMRNERVVFAKINGEEISDKEYRQELDNTVEQMRQQNQGKDIDEATMTQLKEQVWNSMVQRTLLFQEIAKLGIKADDNEVIDWVYNRPESLPQWLKNYFTDSTNVFRTDLLYQTLADKRPEIAKAWAQIETQLRQQLLFDKLQNTVIGSVSVTEGEVLQKYKDDNIMAKYDYMLLDPNTLTDTNLNNVSNEEMKKYYDENKDKFKQPEAVKLRYVVFPEFPSPEDSAFLKKQFETVYINELKAGNLEDSTLIKSVNEYSMTPFSDAWVKPSGYQGNAQKFLFNAKPGDVSGFLADNDGYRVIRLLDVKESSDIYFNPIHILIKFGLDSAASKKRAEDIYKRIKAGENISDLAAVLSEDQSAVQNKGDIGWYTNNGSLVKEFETACVNAKEGDIVGPVKTQFGYHIIKISGKSKKEFKVAEIKKTVTVSDITRNALRKIARDFYTDLEKGKANMDTLARIFKVPVQLTPEVTKDGFIPGAGQNKAIINFAFEKGEGKVMEPVKVQNGFGVYMIVQKIPEGYKNFDSIKTTMIKPMVIQEKKFAIMMQKAKELIPSITGNLFDLKNNPQFAQYTFQQSDSVTVSKSDNSVGMDYAFYNAVFSLKNGELSHPTKGTRGVFIIKMINITPFNEADYLAKQQSIRSVLMQNKQNTLFNEWLAALTNKADIIDNRDLFF